MPKFTISALPGIAAAILTVLSAAPVAAQGNEVCADLWAMRNLAYDRAGQCFNSPLGQATFDNSDCTTNSATPSEPYDSRAVADIRREEELLGCSIDTSNTALPLPNMGWRARLEELPVRSEFESACFGWRRETLYLLDATHNGAAVIGEVQPGDDFLFSHNPQGAYDYISVFRNDRLVNEGWVYLPTHDAEACEGWAG